MSNDMVQAPAAGITQRESFNENALERTAETATTAIAAQARALVEARFVMAMRRPRDLDMVRAKLLRACERVGFAGSATEKVWGSAWFSKPLSKGDAIEGFSIRFAEEAARALGNIDCTVTPIYDDQERRIVSVVVMDLESNTAFPQSIVFDKTVERKFLKRGQEAKAMRVNSYGDTVYIVEATDDEVLVKQNALVSKAMRNGILRVLPGDIQAECRARILAIREGDAAKDPDKVRREVNDAFATLNVLPAMLKDFLGHDLGTATPSELADLRDLFKSLRDGETDWARVMGEVRASRGEAPSATDEPEAKTLASVTKELKSKAKAKPAETKPERDADGDVVPTADDLAKSKEA